MKIDDPVIRRRLRKIKALLMDVDGVLTDGGMYYSKRGEEMKRFNTLDGAGIRLLLEAGLKVAIVTGEDTAIVTRRAEKLRVGDVYLGSRDKLKHLKEFAQKHQIAVETIAYVGDDLSDLPCLRAAGLAFTVPNAVAAVRKEISLVTTAQGGQGAVREIADLLLENRP